MPLGANDGVAWLLEALVIIVLACQPLALALPPLLPPVIAVITLPSLACVDDAILLAADIVILFTALLEIVVNAFVAKVPATSPSVAAVNTKLSDVPAIMVAGNTAKNGSACEPVL